MASKTPFIDKNTAVQAYEESRKWLTPYFEPIAEFERIARNRPSDKIDPSLPKVTDGTMAAIVQETPKRIVQQIPTGLIECEKYPEYARIADLVLRTDLIPMYNRMGDMLQKSWNVIGKGMTWGRTTTYTFYTSTNGIMHTDFVIPYVKDVGTEKGKVYAADSHIRWMRSWYSKRDLEAILRREKARQETDKKYTSDWDLKALADFIDSSPAAKPADVQTPAEKEKGDGNSGGYEVIHIFQEGNGAESYSFGPRFQEGKPIRAKVNKDPRGRMPFDDMYFNIDLSNPLGRGAVELSGGVQNLIDQQMQMFQFLTTVMMAPPVKVWGSVNKATLKMRPNAIWDMGANPNTGNAEVYDVNTHAIQGFPGNYGLLKSQILDLNAAQDHSVSAEAGNPNQSKTQAGVQASESRLGISDNYIRKQYETWFAAQCETSVNIHFSEMSGKQTKQLKGNDLKDLLKTPAARFIDPSGVLTIPYKEITDVAFHFQVDASSSEIKQDLDNADKLAQVYELMSKDPDPNIQQKKPQVLKLLIDEIGAEGTDDLFPEFKTTDENGMPIEQPPQPPAQPPVTPEMVQQMVVQAIQQYDQSKQQQPKSLSESLQIKFADLPEDAKQQVLAQIGIQSQMPTPAAQNQELAATKVGLEVAKTAHDHTLALHQAAQPQPQPQPGQNGQPTMGQGPEDAQEGPQSGQDEPLNPDEQQFAEALMHKGFDEGTVEQAIVLKRRGLPVEQIIRVIGAKQHA